MKKFNQLILFLLTVVAIATACSKDNDYEYPNVLTEFADLKTNDKGTAYAIVTDNDICYQFDEIKSLTQLTPDSTYRIISKFVPNESKEGYADLYYSKGVISPIPVETKHFKQVKTDPVKLQSISICKNYVNIAINVLKKDKQHAFHFMQDSLVKDDDNTNSLYITLYHDSNDDVEAFYETAYLSIPLWAYKNILKNEDKIVVRINTYKDGMITKTFTL